MMDHTKVGLINSTTIPGKKHMDARCGIVAINHGIDGFDENLRVFPVDGHHHHSLWSILIIQGLFDSLLSSEVICDESVYTEE
jgi:hypothetical protein